MLQKIINAGWIGAEPAMRLGIGFVVSVALAAYLGPSDFGTLSYILGVIALLTPIASMGLDALLVRNASADPWKAGLEMGSAILLRFAGSIIAFAAAVVFLSMADGPAGISFPMIILAACSLLFLPLQSLTSFFLANETPVATAIPRLVVLFVMAALTLLMIANRADLMTFVTIKTLETGLLAGATAAIFLAYRSHGARLRSDRASLVRLIRHGLPLLFGALAVTIYWRLDQVMLGVMSAPDQLGSYAIAVRFAEAANFIPMAIQGAVLPALVRAHRKGPEHLAISLQKYVGASTAAMLVVAPLVGIAAQIIIGLALPRFDEAVTLTWILILNLPIVGLGVAISTYFLVRNWLWSTTLMTGCGAIINVALNFLLIPRHGAIGAAIATFVSQIIAAYGGMLLFPWTRSLAIDIAKNSFGLRHIHHYEWRGFLQKRGDLQQDTGRTVENAKDNP